MRKPTLLLGITLLMLVYTAQAQTSCYQGGCSGAIIDVTADGNSDNQECIDAGYEGAAFHCCGYSDCCVPDNEACEYDEYMDCISGYETGNFCQVNTALDGGDYACCITTTTTTSTTTTSTTIPRPCYAPCGKWCSPEGTFLEETGAEEEWSCPEGYIMAGFELECIGGNCYCDTNTPWHEIWEDIDVVAQGTCKPGIPSPEFSSLSMILATLLTAPAFAYLLIKKRH